MYTNGTGEIEYERVREGEKGETERGEKRERPYTSSQTPHPPPVDLRH
jgi:hypothetical protein